MITHTSMMQYGHFLNLFSVCLNLSSFFTRYVQDKFVKPTPLPIEVCAFAGYEGFGRQVYQK